MATTAITMAMRSVFSASQVGMKSNTRLNRLGAATVSVISEKPYRSQLIVSIQRRAGLIGHLRAAREWLRICEARNSRTSLVPDCFYVCKLANALNSQLAANAGAFRAAEGKVRIGDDHAIDEYHTRLDAVDELILFTFFACPGAGAQSEGRGGGDADRVVDVSRAKERSHRAEKLVASRGRIVGNIAEHGRSVEISRAFEGVSSGQQFCSGFDCFLHICIESADAICRRERA